MNKNKIIYIAAALAIVLILVMVFIINNNGNDTVPLNNKSADKNLLVGDWVRTDASYLIKINNVIEDGTLESQYFNPRPINVESANWEEYKGDLKILIVLRDVNYPGSKYTLNYLPDRDILAGEYYQAVEGMTFYVEFVRNK
ncbi:MAG: hypothetical protein KJO12_04335 [Ignavibacteria bacterium]|nr:hypothetical protein [Ignavibacteria bacterium]